MKYFLIKINLQYGFWKKAIHKEFNQFDNRIIYALTWPYTNILVTKQFLVNFFLRFYARITFKSLLWYFCDIFFICEANIHKQKQLLYLHFPWEQPVYHCCSGLNWLIRQKYVPTFMQNLHGKFLWHFAVEFCDSIETKLKRIWKCVKFSKQSWFLEWVQSLLTFLFVKRRTT